MTSDTELLEELPFRRAGYSMIRALDRGLLKTLFRLSVIGSAKIPMRGPVILIANHASFIDPLFVAAATDRIVQFLMYSSFYDSWARNLFRFLGALPIDEQVNRQSLRNSIELLKRGACMGVFPEGAVSFDGNLLPARPGAIFLAQRMSARIVPIAIAGTSIAWPRTTMLPRPGSIVTVNVLDPIEVHDLNRSEQKKMLNRIMDDIAAVLGVRRHLTRPGEFDRL